MTVQRYDRGRLTKAGITPSGGVRLEARIARTGVQSYRMPDGSFRKEYRPPEEVFSAAALNSFIGAPVTIGHPGKVTPDSYKRDAEGIVLAAPTRDKTPGSNDEWARTTVDVNAAEAVAKVESGELVELSAGYTCDFDPTPGIAPDGSKYDGVQRNVQANHLALLGAGKARAGREARLLTDAIDADGNQLILDSEDEPVTKQAKANPMKFVLGGKEFEAGPELQAAIGALESQKLASDAKADAAGKTATEAQAKADAAEKTRKDAEVTPEKLDELIEAEIAFRTRASRVLDERDKDGKIVKRFDFQGKKRSDVMRAAIEKIDSAKLKADADDAYTAVYFDARMASWEKDHKDKIDYSEDYSAPVLRSTITVDASDKLYLDEAAWSAHCRGLHGKVGVTAEAESN